MGVGYVLGAVGPVAVSGIVSDLYFKEFKGVKNRLCFWGAVALMAIAQTMLLTLEDDHDDGSGVSSNSSDHADQLASTAAASGIKIGGGGITVTVGDGN
jgi:hypothetical protein